MSRNPAGTNSSFTIQPSTLVETPANPILVSSRVVAGLQNQLDDITDEPDKHSTVELSEAYERLGMAQFQFGSYRDSVVNLTKALEIRKKLPVSRTTVLMAIYIAIASFRMGDLDKAEKVLMPMPVVAVKLGAPDLAVPAFGNLALIYLQVGKFKDAVDASKKGIDVAMQQQQPKRKIGGGSVDTYQTAEEEEVSPPTVLSLARILLTVYLRMNEFVKAEGVLVDFVFPERERVLMQLGIKFASGRAKDVVRLMEELNSSAAEGGGESKVEVEDGTIAPAAGTSSRAQASELLATHVTFNSAAMSTRRQDYDATLALIHTTLECLDDYSRNADVEGRQDGEDPWRFFEHAQINTTPAVRPVEQSLLPRVVQSHVLAIRGELELLMADFAAPGFAVQAGALLGGLEVTRLPVEGQAEPNEGINEDTASVTSATGGVSAPTSVSMASVAGGGGGSVGAASTTSKTPSVAAAAAAAGNAALAARAKLYPAPLTGDPVLESLRAARGLDKLQAVRHSLEGAKATLTESTQLLLQSQFGHRNDVAFGGGAGGDDDGGGKEEDDEGEAKAKDDAKSAEGGDELAAVVESVGLMDTKMAHNRAALYCSLLWSLDSADRYAEVAKQARLNLKKYYGVALSQRGTLAIGGVKKDVDKTSKIYCPTKHDPLTLIASVLPLLAHGGRNDISLWAQWALGSSGGFGFGVMGSAFSYPEFKRESATKDGPIAAPLLPSPNQMPNKPGETFLKEVKGRIYEVETGLGAKFDGAESQYRPGDKEARVLLNALLAKVCFQLNLRRDCELAVETLEILTADMRNFTQNLDYTYVALARRCRFDLDEWKIPSGSSPEGLATKLLALLGHAKNYLSAVEKTNDLYLLRDALKKNMNIYADFSVLPYPETQPTGFTLPPGETYPPPAGTKEMLAAFTSAEVADKEKSDPLWLRRFGRARSLQFLERYKAITSVDAAEIDGSSQ